MSIDHVSAGEIEVMVHVEVTRTTYGDDFCVAALEYPKGYAWGGDLLDKELEQLQEQATECADIEGWDRPDDWSDADLAKIRNARAA